MHSVHPGPRPGFSTKWTVIVCVHGGNKTKRDSAVSCRSSFLKIGKHVKSPPSVPTCEGRVHTCAAASPSTLGPTGASGSESEARGQQPMEPMFNVAADSESTGRPWAPQPGSSSVSV